MENKTGETTLVPVVHRIPFETITRLDRAVRHALRDAQLREDRFRARSMEMGWQLVIR